jgi:transposase
MHRLQELVRLHRMGTGPREAARMLKMGPNTERKYRQALAAAGLIEGDPAELPSRESLKAAVTEHAPPQPAPQQVSSLEPYAEPIGKMRSEGAGPRAIYDRLRLGDPDFEASYSAMKRFCRRLDREEGVKPEDVAIPVETEPGEVLQVDFGYVGKLYDPTTGEWRKVWAFVAVLGYSRHMWVDLVFDQKVTTWLDLHVRAFRALGGVVRTVVPDNLKAAVIRAAFGTDGPVALNKSYRELARHYGFKVDPTPPRSPEKKGKVEASVKYVKRNFVGPRAGMDFEEICRDLPGWLAEVAGMRVHGTTGRRPLEVFEQEEKQTLSPLPDEPFERVIWKEAKVHRDSHVLFDRRLYSVPWPHTGSRVSVRATEHSITIYANDERVATHSRRGSGVRSTIESHLPDHRSDYRHRSREFWEQRADEMGEVVGRYVREIFDSDDVLAQLRTVQYVVRHLETFPRSRARAACERALYFGNYTYAGIKRILAKALDLEPLPENGKAGRTLESPRFARAPEEYLPLFRGEE